MVLVVGTFGILALIDVYTHLKFVELKNGVKKAVGRRISEKNDFYEFGRDLVRVDRRRRVHCLLLRRLPPFLDLLRLDLLVPSAFDCFLIFLVLDFLLILSLKLALAARRRSRCQQSSPVVSSGLMFLEKS